MISTLAVLAISVQLKKCQYVPREYVGCKAEIAWCHDYEDMCVLKNVKCDITKNGNIALPKKCFKKDR